MKRRPIALAHAAGMTARDREVDVALVERSLPDAPGVRREVAVNRRVDALANERANRRISADEFRAGRFLQAVWEAQDGSKVPGANWQGTGGRSTAFDGLTAADVRMVRSWLRAQRAEHWNGIVAAEIGRWGVEELRSVLCGHGAFSDRARAAGRDGDRAGAEIASRFRALLRAATRALACCAGEGETA